MKRMTIERQRNGWSKAELARRSGLHPTQVGQFEAGRLVPYAGQLQRVAEALGFDCGEPARLLDEVEVQYEALASA